MKTARSTTVFMYFVMSATSCCTMVLHAFWLKGGGGGGGGGGHFEVKEGHPVFFTNNMIFLECGVVALIEAFYMFRDHNHVKSFDMLNDFISSCSAQ